MSSVLKRKLAAIIFTDMVGYAYLMQEDKASKNELHFNYFTFHCLINDEIQILKGTIQ